VTTALKVTDLSARYGRGPQVLHNLSLSLPAGEVLAVHGPGGAGKTTLAQALLAQVPHTGQVRLGARDITALCGDARAKAGLHYIPDGGGLFEGLSVRENLDLGAWNLPQAERRARTREVLERMPWLSVRGTQAAGSLSGGERRMLSIARALMSAAKVWVLDEPAAGLSSKAMQDILPHLVEAKSSGLGIILLEQEPRLTIAIADRRMQLIAGRLVEE